MKLKKHIGYKSGNQIWRILISSKDYLILETRNTDAKQVFFCSFDIHKGKKIFLERQFDEKYWIGIEKVHEGIIYFHGFAKPDMPGHRGIIAFDIDMQKIIWENKQYTFLFLYNEKIYCFVQKFESRDYYVVDSRTGSFIEQLNLSEQEVNELRKKAADEENYSDYSFPLFVNESTDAEHSQIINKFTKEKKIIGDIEYVAQNNFFVCNFHEETDKNNLINHLICYSMKEQKILLNEIINHNTLYPAPDSFFLYKNLLIFVKDKKEVVLYKIER